MYKLAFATALFCALFSLSAQASPGWIGDTIYVPMRSGPGTAYRIVNKGLKTGTRVEILDWDPDEDWVEIRYGNTEGYVARQYVSRQPTASMQLEKRQKAFDEADARLKAMQQKVSEISAQRDQLTREKAALQQQLDQSGRNLKRLQKASAEPLKLARENQALSEEVEKLNAELKTITAENADLQGDRLYRGWRYALLTIFMGMLLGWVVKSLSSRRRSEWG